MERPTPISYRGYWDVPRIFYLTDGGQTYLFDCMFSEDLDDYPDDYRVYLMPPLTEADVAGSWDGLSRLAKAYLGTIPVRDVRFDETRRRLIDAAILDRLHHPAPG